MKNSLLTLLAAFLGLMTSCNSYNEQMQHRLVEADSIMESAPDSALLVLDEIKTPKRLSRKNYAHYCLLKTEGQRKAGRPLHSDSLIKVAVDYYSVHNDAEKAILAYVYLNRTYGDHDDWRERINALLKAESFVPDCKNDNVTGLYYYGLAEIYQKQFLEEEAIPNYEKALIRFRKAGKPKNEYMVLNKLGWCHVKLKHFDVAIKFFEESLTVSEKINDDESKNIPLIYLASAYYSCGQYDKAKTYIYKSINLNIAHKSYASQNVILADIFDYENSLDSARFYYNSALLELENTRDTARLSGLYYKIYHLEKRVGNFQQSLNAHEKYVTLLQSVLDKNQHNSIVEIRHKYNHEKLRAEKQVLTIRNRSLWLALSVVLLLASSTIALYNALVSRKNRTILETEAKRKEEEIEKQRITIEKQDLELKVKDLEVKRSEARTMLLSKVQIMQKMNELNKLWSEDRKDNRRFAQEAKKFFDGFTFTKDSWDELYRIASHVISDNFYNRLAQSDLHLSEDDIRLCCMIVIGLKSREIGLILGIYSNSVSKKRNRLKKKIGDDSDDSLKNMLYSWL